MVEKYIQFKKPYTHTTFNNQQFQATRRNGVVYGMDIDDLGGGVIKVAKGSIILNGLIVEEDETILSTPSPLKTPTYLLATTNDAHETTPLVFTFVMELKDIVSENVAIVAQYDGFEWIGFDRLSIDELIKERDSHNITINGKGVYSGLEGSINDTFTNLTLSPGSLVDASGKRIIRNEEYIFPIGSLDVDFPRFDVITHRRFLGDSRKGGRIERLVGHTYSTDSDYAKKMEPIKETLIDTFIGTAIVRPRNLIDKNNNLHVLWLDGSNLYYSKYNSARTSQLVIKTLIFAGTRNFDAAIDDNNFIHIVIISTPYAVVYTKLDQSGNVVFSPEIKDSQPNNCNYPALIVDRHLRIHIFYSHEHAPAHPVNKNNQIYYLRLNPNGSNDIIPKQILFDTNNNVELDCDIDDDLYIHLGFRELVSGQIRYLITDDSGVIYSGAVTISNNVGGDFGTGNLTSVTDSTKAFMQLKVTPVGEPYIAWRQVIGTRHSLVLYNLRFEDNYGFKAVVIGLDNQELGFGIPPFGVRGFGYDPIDRFGKIFSEEDVNDFSFEVDNFNNLHFTLSAKILDSENYTIQYLKLSNKIYKQLRKLFQIGPHIIKTTPSPISPLTLPGNAFDALGSLVHSFFNYPAFSFLKTNGGIFSEGFAEGDIDTWITEIGLPVGSISKLEDVPITNREKNVLHDFSRKITVGIGPEAGEYVGMKGIKQALEILKGVGGTIEIRPGDYDAIDITEIYSGIKLEAVGRVNIRRLGGSTEVFSATGYARNITTLSTYYFIDNETDFVSYGFVVGDVIDFYDSGSFLSRTRITAIDGSGGVGGIKNIRVHTKDAIPVAADAYKAYRTSFAINGINFIDNPNSGYLRLEIVAKFRIEDCELNDSGGHGILIEDAISGRITHNIVSGNDERGIKVINSEGIVISNNYVQNNAIGSDAYDIELTSTTLNNFVGINKGSILDNGINNQPIFPAIHDTSKYQANDFVTLFKNRLPGINGLSTDPYDTRALNDGRLQGSTETILIDRFEYDGKFNLIYPCKDKRIKLNVEGGWVLNEITPNDYFISSKKKGSKIIITFVGTGIKLNLKMNSKQTTSILPTLNGIAYPIVDLSTGFDFNNFSGYTFFSNVSENIENTLVLEKTSNDNVLEFSIKSIEILYDNARIRTRQGHVYIENIKYDIPEKIITPISAVLNGRTDLVLANKLNQYEILNGTEIDSADEEFATGITDADKAKEEIYPRNFGSQEKNSIYSVTEFTRFDGSQYFDKCILSNDIAVWGSGVLKDHLTFNKPILKLESENDSLFVLFKGTGLSITCCSQSGMNSYPMQVYIHSTTGIPVLLGEFTLPSVSQKTVDLPLDIISNRYDGIHIVEFKSKSGNGSNSTLFLQEVKAYRPKSPAYQKNKHLIASYNTYGTGAAQILKAAERTIKLFGTWYNDSYNKERAYGASLRTPAAISVNYFVFDLVGNKFVIWYDDNNSSYADVYIDNILQDTIPSGTNSSRNKEYLYNTIPGGYGYHTVKIVPNEIGKNFYPNAVGTDDVSCIINHQRISPFEEDVKNIVQNYTDEELRSINYLRGSLGTDIFEIYNNIDKTKKAYWDISAISTLTRRKIIMPDADVDLGEIVDLTQSFVINNNVSSPVGLTGLVWNKLQTKAVRLFFDLHRQTNSVNFDETGELFLTYSPVGDNWRISLDSKFDDAGVTLSITAVGQLQYISSNMAGTNYSGMLRIKNIKELDI